LELIYNNSTTLSVISKFNICRDPKDNMFLDLGFASKADYIISGDKDLLSLERFENCKIVLPSEFIRIFGN
jgi:uncharacterized protein